MKAVSAFIGRDEERRRLVELVATRAMVTVVGTGGMGKTRLVAEVARELGGAFPGGLRRCELAQVAPRADIAAEVAGQLGFPSIDAFVLGSGEERSLLVLDNCEHVLGAASSLCATLLEASPALHVLATSREPLGVDGEHLLVLGPLAVPARGNLHEEVPAPALRLFEDRARAAGASWEASDEQRFAVVELCRRLDGVPLALELAAARTRSLTPVELLQHLDRRFALLTRAAPVGRARHRSLRAAIDASYELLEPVERSFFRALGVFAGPFEASLAHAVAAPAGFEHVDTLDLLGRLVDRSLLTADQQSDVTRYRLLDSLRHYAAEQAVAADEWDGVLRRFIDAMVVEANAILERGLASWAPQLLDAALSQLNNLIAAADACVATERDATRAFQLVLPMWAAIHQGRAAEVAATCDRVLERWPGGAEPLRPEVSAIAANAHLAAGRLERVRALAAGALDDPAATPLAHLVALRVLGIAARHEGDLDAAASAFARAREVAEAAGRAPFERELAVFAASVAGVRGDVAGALATLESVSARSAELGEGLNEVWARLATAQLLIGAGRYAEARDAVAAAERTQRDFDYPYGIKVVPRLQAALIACEEGWESSRGAWRAAIDRTAASGDLDELGVTLRAAAALALRAGDRVAAEALLHAVPAGIHVDALVGLFEEELAGQDLGPAPVAQHGTGEALRRVRAVLDRETPANAVRRPDAATGAPAAAPPAATSATAGPAPADDGAELRRTGDVWSVRFAGRTTQVRHLKGLDDLVVLLARPQQEVHCLELMGGADFGTGAGPDVDQQARREYQRRVRELQEEVDEARDANDVARAERAEAELDALVQQLAEAFGLGGRARTTGSAAERARSAVTWRLRAAVKRIGEVHPELGRHLGNALRTGTWCSYRPETAVGWRLGG
jgi:predicted ATPase